MNSKKIGNSYERMIAKVLSKWFTGSDKELVVWRNVHSGSVGTVRKKKGLDDKNVNGDFQAINKEYAKFFEHFHVDSKSLTNINLHFIDQKNQKSNKLLNEWIKVKNDAGSRIPLMIVKLRDNKKVQDFIVLPYNFLVEFKNIAIYHLETINIDFRILSLNEFLSLNTWEDLIKISDNIKSDWMR